MTVPKRRPPSPHSCNWSRSPLRQWAAAKPSQVMKPNRATKTISAVQFTSCTAFLPTFRFLISGAPRGRALIFVGEVHDRSEHRTDDHPEHLVPIEKRNADPGRLDLVVEGRPDDRDELNQKKQIPPAPSAAPLALSIHVRPPVSRRLY